MRPLVSGVRREENQSGGLLRQFLQWVVRRVLLYGALVLAIAGGTLLFQEWTQASELKSEYRDLAGVEEQLRNDRAGLRRAYERSTAKLKERSTGQLDQRIRNTEREITNVEADLGADQGVRAWLRQGPQVLLVNQRHKMQLVRLRHQLKTLQAARDLADRGAQRQRLEATLREAKPACARATKELKALKSQWSSRLRSWIGKDELKELEAAKAAECGKRNEAQQRLDRLGRVQDVDQLYERSVRDLDRVLDRELSELISERADAQTRWNGTAGQKLRLWAESRSLDNVLWTALVALLAIIATPYLIRLLFWCVLAPLAERSSAIQLQVPGERGPTIPPAERSATAVAIRLSAEEELLVRQKYLQTTSQGGKATTRWLLDWRHPMASVVTGLRFLTRIRGGGETTTVSAVADPFAEVTVLTLPEGASCVLQPRAIAAVVQPIGRPLRVTSQWRIRSRNAWLTMQLRYLVFHGPCSVVLKGGRGVRVERAHRGRIFGQAQLIGFTADLGYSVTRTETFWPYFWGHEQLFKDKVEGGEGVLLIEEAPMAGRKRGAARRGWEDVFEVMTKAVGI